jgi:hypothetical protein
MASNEELVEEARLGAAIEAQEVALVDALGLKPYKDGNQWCFLWGENLQEGIAGFGDTVQLAMFAFNKAYRSEKIPVL